MANRAADPAAGTKAADNRHRGTHQYRTRHPKYRSAGSGSPSRARPLKALSAALDQLIPPDESVPLKGATFLDVEDQVEQAGQSVLPVLLEEQAALEPEVAGRCPFRGSQRVYLKEEAIQPEVRSPYGQVVLEGERVQSRQKNAETGSRWREDKVATVSSYLPGGGTADKPPQPLVITHVATMENAEGFGKMVHVEAKRYGLRRAATVPALSDGGNRIDLLVKRKKLYDRRISQDDRWDRYWNTRPAYSKAA